MDITFPINKLLAKGLTADDYTILSLLKEKKYGLLKKYINLDTNSFYQSINKLKKLKFISYIESNGVIPLKEIIITDELNNLGLIGDNFDEFYEAYPVKVVRPDGTTDYLRRDKTKCKVKYKRIIKNNLLLHDYIIDCLKFDIQSRDHFGSTTYMKRMKNWLDAEEWKILAEQKENFEKAKIKAAGSSNNTYGTELI